MYGVLWPDKDTKSAKNLKGVFISRLRKVLEELEGITLTYNNNLYSIVLSDEFNCDYKEYLQVIDQLMNNNTADKDTTDKLSRILKRGKFLRSVDGEDFDNLKSRHEEKLLGHILFELNKLYLNQNYDMVIDLSEAVLKIDPFNDMAIWYLLNSYYKLKKEDIAMKKYYLFVASYSKNMGTDYTYSYYDIIRLGIKEFMGR